jgi:hypothetical protein
MYPMHPRSEPFFVRVTKAPRFSRRFFSFTSVAGTIPFLAYPSMVLRAMERRTSCSYLFSPCSP